jgi:hypothetical protein
MPYNHHHHYHHHFIIIIITITIIISVIITINTSVIIINTIVITTFSIPAPPLSSISTSLLAVGSFTVQLSTVEGVTSVKPAKKPGQIRQISLKMSALMVGPLIFQSVYIPSCHLVGLAALRAPVCLSPITPK